MFKLEEKKPKITDKDAVKMYDEYWLVMVNDEVSTHQYINVSREWIEFVILTTFCPISQAAMFSISFHRFTTTSLQILPMSFGNLIFVEYINVDWRAFLTIKNIT